MSGNRSEQQESPSLQSRALLNTYNSMRGDWADRIANEGIAGSRAFADLTFDRFRGGERDVAPEQIIDLKLPGEDDERAARLYRPAIAGDAPPPLALFLHGGGWSLGGISAYDGLVGSLAALSGMAIVSLDYRLAPEHPFPAGLNDARRALDWLFQHGAAIGGDPARLAVIGDSAGGNLAAVLAREAAQADGPDLVCQVLIYPMTDIASPHTDFASRGRFGQGDFFLVAEAIEFARDNYLADGIGDAQDPCISPLLAPVPDGLAPAMVVTAGFDPLRDEAIAYHEKMQAAGVDSTHYCAQDSIHAFLSFGVLDAAQTARRLIADYLHRMMNRLEP